MTARAEIYSRGGSLFVGGMSKTDTGLWIGRDVTVLPAGTSEASIGKAVLAALASSRSNVPHPPRDEMNHLADPLLKLAGVRSFRQFMPGTKALDVERDGQLVTITPMRNAGPKFGFLFLEKKATKHDQIDDGQLGLAVLAALDQAE